MFDLAPDTRHRAVKQVADYVDAMLEAPSAFRGPQVRGGGAVAEFERILARRCGFPYCLATANATSGLLAIVAAANLKGRKVLVPEDFWAGTPGALRFAGVEVVTAPRSTNGTLDLSSVERLLSAGDVAAIVAGECENLHRSATELHRVCEASHCLYIEDSSWLPGVSAPGNAPSIADVQIMSFGPGKPLSLGEGGAVLTRHEELYEHLVACSQHPERCFVEEIECELDHLALNSRIHPLAAVLGVVLLSDI